MFDLTPQFAKRLTVSLYVFGTICLLLFLLFFYKEYSYKSGAKVYEAKITKLVEDGINKQTDKMAYKPIVSVVDDQGVELYSGGITPNQSSSGYKFGESFEVLFNPEVPDKAVKNVFLGTYFLSFVFGFFSFVTLLSVFIIKFVLWLNNGSPKKKSAC